MLRLFGNALLLHIDLWCWLHAALEPLLIYKAKGMGKICEVNLQLIYSWSGEVTQSQCCSEWRTVQ